MWLYSYFLVEIGQNVCFAISHGPVFWTLAYRMPLESSFFQVFDAIQWRENFSFVHEQNLKIAGNSGRNHPERMREGGANGRVIGKPSKHKATQDKAWINPDCR